jgi:hypothetical protein
VNNERRPCIGYDCDDNEGTLNENQLCRDCSIQQSLDLMQCSGCQRMRYRTETSSLSLGPTCS